MLGVPLEASRVWAPVGKSRRWGSPWSGSDDCSPGAITVPSPPGPDHHSQKQSSPWGPLLSGRHISKHILCRFHLIFLVDLWRKYLHLPFGWWEDRVSVISRNSLSWHFRPYQSWDTNCSVMVTFHCQLEKVERCVGDGKVQFWACLWGIFPEIN